MRSDMVTNVNSPKRSESTKCTNFQKVHKLYDFDKLGTFVESQIGK